MYILYIIVLKIKLITNLHALSVAIHVPPNTRTKTPLVGWAILVPSSNRTPSVTRSVLARRPLPTAFPGRSGRGSSRTPHRCRHRQVFAGRVMPVNPRAVVDSLTRPRTMRAVVSFSPIQHRDHRCSKM